MLLESEIGRESLVCRAYHRSDMSLMPIIMRRTAAELGRPCSGEFDLLLTYGRNVS